MSASRDDALEIDSVCPHGPDEHRPISLEFARAIDDGTEVGVLYSKFYGATEWLQADVDAFQEVSR